MAHPLVTQLRFTRSQFVRCVGGVTAQDAQKRLFPMNCISWIVGHLASQENAYWSLFAQGKKLQKGLNDRVGFGKPASTPPLDEMWQAWHEVTGEADKYLDILTTEILKTHLLWKEKPLQESIGTMLLRNIYHYWFHTGEAYAIRQQLGHTSLPIFVGEMDSAFYSQEK
jgi:uncharacterized damage-inducible protein DinB